MRKAMRDHAIIARELIDHIHAAIGGDRDRVVRAVDSFVLGAPGSIAVHVGIIELIVQQNAIKH